jgi:hypothetical protein
MTDIATVWPQTIRFEEAARARPDTPLRRRLVADEAARAALARALGLEALERLDADLALHGWFDGAAIEGRWSARIEQICGVSLEPFQTDLAGEFLVRVVPPGSVHAPSPEAEVTIDLDADDPPDVAEGDLINLGAYVVEHLALEIDPFPRRPDAVFEAPEPDPEASPFAVLRALKRDGGSE